jgi:hypothetical protein
MRERKEKKSRRRRRNKKEKGGAGLALFEDGKTVESVTSQLKFNTD